MSSSPWSPVAGAPPRAAPAAVSSAARERHPVEGSRSLPAQEEGSAAAAQEATRARLPSEDRCSEVNTQEHGEKINKYQVVLAARLKAKYFSSETFEKGDVFEEIAIQSETIHLSSNHLPFDPQVAVYKVIFRPSKTLPRNKLC
ncbi:uncharacterized protein LOC133895785 isoform X3 [Phragmites australis]|uniref:uncharacterized protein LOC133895785 isoform X3 n=1 Tax=Phragmites australis TaxID=29695 RepID=UPI002D77167C|nr:uncharacterized protein LOC133895785 isoform X3 [Phragmites australis]